MDLEGINLDEIRKELSELDESEIEQQLLDIQTKRRVSAKRANRDPEKMKAARKRRMAKIEEMKAALGPEKWEQLKKRADARADALIAGDDPAAAEAEVVGA